MSPCEHFFLPANLSQDGKQLEGTSGGLVLAHSKANLEVGQDCLEPLSYLKISEEGDPPFLWAPALGLYYFGEEIPG